MIVLFQAKRGEKMKAKNMKAEIVKVIRTDTAEGKKSNGWTGSSIMRNWKAGMMQRRWRDSEDQLTRV